MECLIGIRGKDFVLLASDTSSGRSIVSMKQDQDKMVTLSTKVLMAVCGESGDTIQFSEYIEKNLQLYKMRNGYELSPHAAANFTRRNLADALRTRDRYMVNLLIGGYDDEAGPELYFMDYLGSLVKLPFAVHGYGSYFSLSIMDRHYKEDLSEREAQDLLQKCVQEIHKRLIVNLPAFKVRKVTKDGVESLPDIKPQPSV